MVARFIAVGILPDDTSDIRLHTPGHIRRGIEELVKEQLHIFSATHYSDIGIEIMRHVSGILPTIRFRVEIVDLSRVKLRGKASIHPGVHKAIVIYQVFV